MSWHAPYIQILAAVQAQYRHINETAENLDRLGTSLFTNTQQVI